ncbi:hypothetical protein B4N84_06410 [Flavobacterium sp. IR1]|nr:hypothetical protein B4N84_06410 [Flavobacterium sp. IR1]
MKTRLLIILFVLSVSSKCFAQSTPADGHYLTWVQDNVKVYQSIGGTPVLTAYKYWEFKYWFYAEDEPITLGNEKYIKIFIPNSNESVPVITEEAPWNAQRTTYITDEDENKWLFLNKNDFDRLKKDHFPKRTWGLIISAMTVPFKIRPKTGERKSSLYNSNWNAGTFIGCRLGFLNDVLGISAGGFLEVSSLNQTSAENTSIIDNSSTTMSALNYGGGILIDLSRKFQMGAIVGWDHGYGDLSSTYIYQDKAWFALSLNFNFLDLSKRDNTQ